MHSFSILLLCCTFLSLLVSAQQSSQLPCYQASCSPLVEYLKGCQITVDPNSGNINFPTQNNSTDTAKCLCTQKIINAFDPCFKCGAENKKIQNQYSTQNLVDSCNVQFGASTVSIPSSSNGMTISSSLVIIITVFSTVFVFV